MTEHENKAALWLLERGLIKEPNMSKVIDRQGIVIPIVNIEYFTGGNWRVEIHMKSGKIIVFDDFATVEEAENFMEKLRTSMVILNG